MNGDILKYLDSAPFACRGHSNRPIDAAQEQFVHHHCNYPEHANRSADHDGAVISQFVMDGSMRPASPPTIRAPAPNTTTPPIIMDHAAAPGVWS